MLNELTSNVETAGNSVVTTMNRASLVDPANRAKVAQTIKKIEGTVVNAAQAFMSGNSDEGKVSLDLLKMQALPLLPLINQDVLKFFGTEPKSADEAAKQAAEVLNVIKEITVEFPKLLETSKALPYAKLACSVVQNIHAAKDASFGFASMAYKMISENVPAAEKASIDLVLNVSNEACDIITSIDNSFDDNTSVAIAGLNSLINLINDPLALINESQLV